MATAVTAIETDEVAVRQFLQSLFHKQAIATDAAAPAALSEAATAAAGGLAGTPAAPPAAGTFELTPPAAAPATPLWLHPCVDAAHPMVCVPAVRWLLLH